MDEEKIEMIIDLIGDLLLWTSIFLMTISIVISMYVNSSIVGLISNIAIYLMLFIYILSLIEVLKATLKYE